MASITSLSNSNYNTSSIYGNRNVLSGLASGMDTETMIENAVSGIKLKIQNLQKKRTKVEWQQEAYRSIIDKAVNFNTKYTSYSSKTNLLSQGFFNNAVTTKVLGTYADKLTASGKTNSDIKINAVKQMAKAATYNVSGLGGLAGDVSTITGKEGIDLSGNTTVSTVSGTLSFQYGGTNGASFDISFDELEDLNEVEVFNEDGSVKEDAGHAEKLAQAIRNKLGDITYNYTKNGVKETTSADKAILVNVDGSGRISFKDGLGTGNAVKISSSAGAIKGIVSGNTLAGSGELTKEVPTYEYLGGKKGDDGKWSGGKELGITFNGATKKIDMSKVLNESGIGGTEDKDSANTKFKIALQKELDNAFGTGKVQAEVGTGKLVFKTGKEGDTLSIGGSAAKALGFENGDSNFINPAKKLSELLGEDNELFTKNRLRGEFKNYDAKPIEKTSAGGEKYFVDEKGNRVDEDGFRITNTGKSIYDFQVNDAHIEVTEDTTLESLINSINSNPDAAMKVSYSKLTNEFKFTTNETGANSKIEFGGLAKDLFASHDRTADSSFSSVYGLGVKEGKSKTFDFKLNGVTYGVEIKDTDSIKNVAEKLNDMIYNEGWTASFDELSGQLKVNDSKTGKTIDYKLHEHDSIYEYKPKFEASYTAGQDAVMDVEINGRRFENLSRASNTFDIDGLNVTVKGEFTTGTDKDGKPEEAVTFQTSTDSDKIVDAIKSFVEDYNEMVTEIKNQYSTMPATKNGATNGKRYEPLTAEEEEKYTESELKAYNEKAKQGILFGDTNLSSMYSKLLGAITPGGTDGQTLREIGIGTSYSNGMTTLSLDEDKLRAALDSDPDKVRTAFTKTREGGSSSDGLMQTMQNTLNSYVKAAGEPKGILIQRAGSVKSPTSLNNNSLKSQIDNIDNQIDRWTNKMADQIDRYTTQFSRLEQLIAQMNSQASALSGLMGGQGGY